jgi:hypothetical protein
MTSRPILEVTVSASVDQVWRALREPAQIAQWFGWDAESLPAEIDFIFVEHAIVDDAARTLKWDGQPSWFEVEDRGGQAVVRLVRAAPAGDADWDDIFDDMTQGWIAFIYQLKLYLDRHADDRRRTVFFAGAPRPGASLLIPALGLASAAGTVAIAALADPVTGSTFYRTRFQLGVAVPAYGDGLISIIDAPPTPKRPRGAPGSPRTTTPSRCPREPPSADPVV